MVDFARSSGLYLEVLGTETIKVVASGLNLSAIVSQRGTGVVTTFNAEVLTVIGGPTRAVAYCVEVLVKIGTVAPYKLPYNTLPWTIAPDWQPGVTERLKWKTDILASQNGTEQRRRLRTAPRREIEATYRLYGRDRRFLDACLAGPGRTLWLVPLWWDRYSLLADVAENAVVLQADTLFGEMQAGDTIMLIGSSPLIYELVTVQRLDPAAKTISLGNNLQKSWGAGTSIYTTKKCRLLDKQTSSRKGSDASDTVLSFETTEVNDAPAYDPPFANPPPGLQLEFRPNWISDLSYEYAHLYATFDTDIGLTSRRDLGLRTFYVQQFEYLATSRSKHNRFRGFLYYMQGRLRTILMPTYSADMDLVPYTAIGPDSDLIQIISAGYATYLRATIGSTEPDRDAIIFFFHDGTTLVSFIKEAVYTGPDGHGHNIEAIRLQAPVGRAITYSNVDKISFMQTVRQDQDDFEIKHETHSTGTTKFATTFRSVGPVRSAVPYTLQFTGTYVKNDAPGQIPVDITKYNKPPSTDFVTTPTPYMPEEWHDAGGGGGSDESGA